MKVLVYLLLAAALLLTAADANVTGKWSGTFSTDDGSDSGSAVVILKQTGHQITGSGGSEEDPSWPIEKGTVTGNKVNIEVKRPDGTLYKCDLVVDGDHLKGAVAVTTPDGQAIKGKLDLARVK